MKAPAQGFSLAQYQQGGVTGQDCVRVDVDIGNSIAFDSQNIDAVFLADIDVTDGLSDPCGRHRYFQNGMVVIQFNIIQHMVGPVADSRPFGQLLFRVKHLIRTVAQQKLACTSRSARETTSFAPSSFSREVVSSEL